MTISKLAIRVPFGYGPATLLLAGLQVGHLGRRPLYGIIWILNSGVGGVA